MSIFGEITDELETLQIHLRSALRRIASEGDERSTRIAERALAARVHKCWECDDHYIEDEGCRSSYCLEASKQTDQHPAERNEVPTKGPSK